MPHPAPPPLHTDHRIALLQNTELDGVLDAPLQPLVDVLLPRDALEVGLGFGVEEGVDAAVEVGVAGGAGVARDHDDGADGAVFGDEAGGVAAVGEKRVSEGWEREEGWLYLPGGEDEDGAGVLLQA